MGHILGAPNTDWFAINALAYGLVYGYLLRMVYCKVRYGEV